VRKFTTRNRYEVILRKPTATDLDDTVEIINKLVEVNVDIDASSRVTRLGERPSFMRWIESLER